MSRTRKRSFRASLDERGAVRKPMGFTLIELMIALLLGAIVIAGVVSVFLGTQQSYRANQALGDVQDGSRIAFDLMSRDIREAGLTGCYSTGTGSVANVLSNSPNNSGTVWWANWGNTIHGYSSGDPALTVGTGAKQQVTGTDSLELVGASDLSVSVATHVASTSTFTLNESTSTLVAGDVVVACDPNHSVVLQLSTATGSPLQLTYASPGLVPGNCSTGLAFPTVCTTTGTSYTYGANAQIARLNASDWYIGNYNDTVAGTKGTSLYRADLETNSTVPTVVPEEMVRNVSAMTILYHQLPNTAFLSAASITNWAAVDSVQVTLTLQSSNQLASTSMKPIVRTFTSTTTLRNRVK